MIIGAIVPWLSNVLYPSGALRASGLDLTPIGFTVSGVCFTWALYRYRLFGRHDACMVPSPEERARFL